MKKLENFSDALENLRLCRCYSAPYDVVTQTGLVNLFSICFEQSWKAMKEILEKHGYMKTGSPKMIIKLAYQAGMIQDETALQIIEKTKGRYLVLFEALERELLENWL